MAENAQGYPTWLPRPWRIEEDWTLEITAANGKTVCKLPLQCLVEAERIVDAVNRVEED